MWGSNAMRTAGMVAIAGAILFGSFWFSDAACTPSGTTTPNFGFCKPAVGEVGWGAVVNANMDTIDGNLTNALPRSYLAGLQLSDTIAATATQISIAAGVAQDAGQAGAMILSSTLTKDLSAPWAVGNNNGGLCGACSYSASTWYHVFEIKRTDTNVVDAYFDTSVSAANIPAPYTLFRRIGSVRTDGSKNILQFTQDGDYVRWAASVLDVNTTNPGTGAITATLTNVPTGVNVMALMNVFYASSTDATPDFLYLSDLAANNEAASSTGAPLAMLTANSSLSGVSQVTLRTNTSSQIRYRLNVSDANSIVRIATLGWLDPRGRNN